MINSRKKGFTLVELVIVIAVIAILAAVLIPTFSSLVKRANMSADQQAVRQMNTALAIDSKPEDFGGAVEVLDKAIKNKSLERALECEIPAAVYDRIRKIIVNVK